VNLASQGQTLVSEPLIMVLTWLTTNMAYEMHGYIKQSTCIEAQDMLYATRLTVQMTIRPDAEPTAKSNNLIYTTSHESGN
jgi:hypothetical protein